MSKGSQRAHAKMGAKRQPGRRPAGAAALALTDQDRRDIREAIALLEGTPTPEALATVRELLIRLQGKAGAGGATLWFGKERG